VSGAEVSGSAAPERETVQDPAATKLHTANEPVPAATTAGLPQSLDRGMQADSACFVEDMRSTGPGRLPRAEEPVARQSPGSGRGRRAEGSRRRPPGHQTGLP
jgi:hypothetical protein